MPGGSRLTLTVAVCTGKAHIHLGKARGDKPGQGTCCDDSSVAYKVKVS